MGIGVEHLIKNSESSLDLYGQEIIVCSSEARSSFFSSEERD